MTVWIPETILSSNWGMDINTYDFDFDNNDGTYDSDSLSDSDGNKTYDGTYISNMTIFTPEPVNNSATWT